MKRFVLDGSVALTWCFEDESSEAADRLLESLDSVQAVVPIIWLAEVGNALLAAERRKRLTAGAVSRSLTLLRSLNIVVDVSETRTEVGEWMGTARSQNLSVYDAAYLVLAVHEGLPLATLSRALQQAGRKIGVEMLIH